MQAASDWLVYDATRPILFNSAVFLKLFIGFYALYLLLLNTQRARILYVTAFSLFFYYKCSGYYFVLLLFSSLVDYYISQGIYKSTKQGTRSALLVISCIVNLGMLVYFKYTGFLADNFNALFQGNLSFENVVLPVGISFYTFQTMSYTIDIYRKELKPTKSLLDFMFFVSFFPQLVAGPIVRAADFIPQIYSRVSLTKQQLSYAFFLIIGGLLKKAVISDYLSVNFVDRVFDFPQNYSAFENLLAVYGYTLQIYCDFSGYSDIAIGLALLMGFTLPINFNTPYKSSSITEFWRRWHISLSSWLRDYLYISLGGNRKGKLRTYFNLFMTMFLGGLWHGANWKFVLWGSLHGIILAIEKAFNIPKISSRYWFLKVLGILISFHFVAACWILFRASSLDVAIDIVQRISTITYSPTAWWNVISGYQNVMIIMLLGYLWHAAPRRFIDGMLYIFTKTPMVLKAIIFTAVIWLIYATASSEVQPFIYFQF
jgi:D-alanyl-lipoteichoic acid acyltransferase DltB (MBOAT superfamily)